MCSKIILSTYLFFLLCKMTTAQTNPVVDIKLNSSLMSYVNNQYSYPAPIQDAYEGSRCQYLYRASELNYFGMSKGFIFAIKFYANSLNNIDTVEQYTIKIGHTTSNVMPTNNWLPGTTTVYGPNDIVPNTGINIFTFTTPFEWNGIDNIVLEICNGAADNANRITSSYNCSTGGSNYSFVCSHTSGGMNTGNLCGTSLVTQIDFNSRRPNTTFTWQSSDSCLPKSVVYEENFDIAPYPKFPPCITAELNSSGVWVVYGPDVDIPYFTTQSLYFFNNTSNSADAWVFTRGVQLTGGVSYRLSFGYGNYSNLSNKKEKLNVFYGDSASSSHMNYFLAEYPNISNYDSATSVTDFTPVTSGVYYFGFHGYSDPNNDILLVDGIEITENTTTPVTLLSFTGKAEGVANLLQWQTATEVNNKGFVMERSANGVEFNPLAFVASKGAYGNSSLPLSYAYVDAKPYSAISYYRLKQTDYDGKYTYSNIVAIKGNGNSELLITHVFPNPAKDRLQVFLQSPTKQLVSMVLTDLLGKVVLQQKATLQKGSNLQTLHLAALSSGVYILKLVCSNGCVSGVSKVVKE